jgi:YVTN family beta-propeller protein
VPTNPRVYVTSVTQNISGVVTVIDSTSNTVVATVPVGPTPCAMTMDPAGTRVYVANGLAHTISVIDTATNSVVATIDVGCCDPGGLAINPSGTRLYAAKGLSGVSIVDTATNTMIGNVTTENYKSDVAVANNGLIYIASYGDNTLWVVDPVTNGLLAKIPLGAEPHSLAIDGGGRRVYVGIGPLHGQGAVLVVDATTNTVIAVPDVGYNIGGIALMPDETRLYVVNSDSTFLSVIETAGNTVAAQVSGVFRGHFGKFIGPGQATVQSVPVPTLWPGMYVLLILGIALVGRRLSPSS